MIHTHTDPPEPREEEPRGPTTPSILRVPLFVKLLVANALLMAVVGLGTLGVVTVLLGAEVDRATLWTIGAFVATTLVLGAVVNAVLIRLALSPLEGVIAAAEAVHSGTSWSEAESSRLADPATSRLIEVFNRMLDSIQASRDRQHELALRVLQAEERERERLAHELYSGSAQTLAGVLVRLRLSDQAIDEPPATRRNGVTAGHLREEVAQALEEIRGVARRLRPPELDDLGIRAAVVAHGRSLSEKRGLEVEVAGNLPEERLTPDAGLAVFRICQEALTNAALHSGGERVTARFTPRSGDLLIEVEDDGGGFEVAELFTRSEPNLGTTGMRERAVYVGGSFAIDAKPGKGTRVRATVPWASPRPTPIEPIRSPSALAEEPADAAAPVEV